jgi:ribonuclease VapC
MILDSSAIVAVILAESGYDEIRELIGAAEIVGVGAPTVVESGIVLSARIGRDARPELNEFLRVAEAEVISFGLEHFHAALDAFLRFGKGRHPASLNFGDCLSYAIASVAGLPLLYTGKDFSKTDIPSAGTVRPPRPQKS